MDSFRAKFTVSATIGAKRMIRNFLDDVANEVNYHDGIATVSENSGWFESIFTFRATDLSEGLKDWILAQYTKIKDAE